MSRFSREMGMTNSCRYRESGLAMLELALALPIVLIISFVSIETARSLRYVQVASTLSREVASLAYRDCVGDKDEKLMFCLRNVRDEVLGYANNLIGGSEVIVSMYTYDGTTAKDETSYEAGESSQYTLAGTAISGLTDTNFLTNQRIVVIGEVYIPYEPLVPRLSSAFNLGAKDYYDATVL